MNARSRPRSRSWKEARIIDNAARVLITFRSSLSLSPSSFRLWLKEEGERRNRADRRIVAMNSSHPSTEELALASWKKEKKTESKEGQFPDFGFSGFPEKRRAFEGASKRRRGETAREPISRLRAIITPLMTVYNGRRETDGFRECRECRYSKGFPSAVARRLSATIDSRKARDLTLSNIVEKENSRLDRGNLALRRVLRGSTPFIDFPPVAFALEDETVQARR